MFLQLQTNAVETPVVSTSGGSAVAPDQATKPISEKVGFYQILQIARLHECMHLCMQLAVSYIISIRK